MPPSGYEPRELGPKLDLSNKQIYLAQVPTDFDVKKATFKSETEILCNDQTYFVNSSSVLADCVILNRNDDDSYSPSSTSIESLLAFTKRVPLPKIDYEKVTHPKPLVKQKQNLRMRHFASGYGAKDYNVDTKPVESTESVVNIEQGTPSAATSTPKKSKSKSKSDSKSESEDVSENKDKDKKRHKHSKEEGSKKRKKEKKEKKDKR